MSSSQFMANHSFKRDRLNPEPYLLWLITLCSLLFGTVAYSAESHFLDEFNKQYTAVKELCNDLSKVKYPESDKPSISQLPSLKKCDEVNLYYGIEHKVDYIQARLCAISGKEDMNAGILMMLYANGQNVKRNYTLAKKAACEFDGAPAEIVGRMEHLDAMESGKKGSNPKIDICDDITSGMMQGICASIDSSLQDQTRKIKFDKITSHWNVQEKVAFNNLQIVANKYITLTSENEVDRSGTAGSAFAIAEEVSQKDDFLKSIIDFEAGELPKFTQNDFVKSDRQLNKVYAQLKRLPEPEYGSTINMEGIQHVQRAWLEYRDAWVTFGKIKYPAVSDYSWRTHFTNKRLAILKELINSW